MTWLFIVLLGFFGFGTGRAIKLYYITRDSREYWANLRFPLRGVTLTFVIGGILHRYAGMPAPVDNWLTWVIIGGPFLGALFADEDTLRIGQR